MIRYKLSCVFYLIFNNIIFNRKPKERMNSSASIIFSILLGVVCAITALKQGECEGKNFTFFL